MCPAVEEIKRADQLLPAIPGSVPFNVLVLGPTLLPHDDVELLADIPWNVIVDCTRGDLTAVNSKLGSAIQLTDRPLVHVSAGELPPFTDALRASTFCYKIDALDDAKISVSSALLSHIADAIGATSSTVIILNFENTAGLDVLEIVFRTTLHKHKPTCLHDIPPPTLRKEGPSRIALPVSVLACVLATRFTSILAPGTVMIPSAAGSLALSRGRYAVLKAGGATLLHRKIAKDPDVIQCESYAAASMYYQGGGVSVVNLVNDDLSLVLSYIEDVAARVNALLERARQSCADSQILQVMHMPGGGGSSCGWAVLWQLRHTYPALCSTRFPLKRCCFSFSRCESAVCH